MSNPPVSFFIAFTSLLNPAVSTVNVSSTDSDGTINTTGTVIGVAQSAQGMVALGNLKR